MTNATSTTAATKYTIPAILIARIAALTPAKSIEQIAKEAGFRKPTTLELVLSGEIALPVDRIFDLARAVRCKPVELFRHALEDWRLERALLPLIQLIAEADIAESELELLTMLRAHLAGRHLVINDAVAEWISAFPEPA